MVKNDDLQQNMGKIAVMGLVFHLAVLLSRGCAL
jgi:hypothetical protein